VSAGEIHVLALIDHFGRGGAELLLGQFAAAAPDAGIRLSVACLKQAEDNPAAQRLRDLGLQPVILELPERLGLRALRGVGNLIASVRPDIVHTHLGTSDLLGGLAAWLLRVPAVSTIHAMSWQDGYSRARVRLALMAFARRRGAARIIAVSESARASYLSRGWDVPNRVVTLHNGIDVSPNAGAGSRIRRELGLSADDFVIGMISALRPEKGHDVALSAVERLRVDFPHVRLLIAGDGAARATVEHLAQPLGDGAILTGARSDVMSLFDSLDVCLQPSKADALPTTLLEAMAASVPIVASAVGGIPEIVEDGVTGILVPAPPTPADVAEAIARLIEDPPRRRALAEAGRRRYDDRFGAKEWALRTRCLYEAVLAERGRARVGRRRDVAQSLRRASGGVSRSLFTYGVMRSDGRRDV
jgi:glycosyltransferase involved in cell wall biosynthesis